MSQVSFIHDPSVVSYKYAETILPKIVEIEFPSYNDLMKEIPKYSTINSVTLSGDGKVTSEASTAGTDITASIRREYGYDNDGTKTTSYRYTDSVDIVKDNGKTSDDPIKYSQTFLYGNFSSQMERAGEFVSGKGYNGDATSDSTRGYALRITVTTAYGLAGKLENIYINYNFTGPKIVINSGTNGTVNNGGSHTVNTPSQTIECTAIPNNGYRFKQWNDGNTSNPRIFSQANDDIKGTSTTYTAIFEPYYTITYQGVNDELILNSLPKGYLTDRGLLDDDLNIINEFSFQLLQLNKVGYNFIGWTGSGIDNPVSSTTIEVRNETGHKEFTANWEPIQYEIIYTYNGGTYTGTEIKSYTIEDTITLLPPEKTGYTFLGWTRTGLSEQPVEVVSWSNEIGKKEFTANWDINRYKITGSSYPEGAGNFEIAIDGNIYTNNNFPIYQEYDTYITSILVNPSNSTIYKFNHFEIINETNNIVINKLPFEQNIIQGQKLADYNTNFKAYFDLNCYPITVSSKVLEKDEFGNLTEVDDNCAIFMINNNFNFSEYEYGSNVDISFSPKTGYKFKQWKNVGASQAKKSILNYKVIENNNIIACFERVDEQDSIPEDVENLPENEKNNVLISLSDSIIDKSIEEYINTKMLLMKEVPKEDSILGSEITLQKKMYWPLKMLLMLLLKLDIRKTIS